MFIFGLGLGMYMLGATVLLVLGAEAAAVRRARARGGGRHGVPALGRPAHLEHVAWAVLAATPLLALGLAVARTSRGASFATAAGRRLGTKPAPGC